VEQGGSTLRAGGKNGAVDYRRGEAGSIVTFAYRRKSGIGGTRKRGNAAYTKIGTEVAFKERL